MKKQNLFLLAFLIFGFRLCAQFWQPDLGNGKYKNPIIYADYSDPDIVKVGEDFYMIASSFNCMPGIPILHSKDMVNWEIINHVFKELPIEKYNKPDHGNGCWAPSIRYHNNLFYVYFCTPYDGLFVATAQNLEKNWKLKQIIPVELWEDPCPFWDDDGKAYLVRSKFCGNELFIHKLSPDGFSLLDNGISIYRDTLQPTIEGPKLFKKKGYYYIFAPAGGVSAGWQTVLRSKNIYGPYESKIILHQGNTNVNGPHQGGLVELESGESWFVHFQDKPPYGRIAHLQPVKWVNDWPVIGLDQNGDGIGEPVLEYTKPNVGKNWPACNPQTSDEFENKIGLQWQWHANHKKEWFAFTDGKLRLNAVKNNTQNGNLWFSPNLLLQKFPAPEFTFKTKIEFQPDLNGEKAGLLIMGLEWAFVAFEKTDKGLRVAMYKGIHDRCDPATKMVEEVQFNGNTCYFKVSVKEGGLCTFSYSIDNKEYKNIGAEFGAKVGRWIGAKVGLFCLNPNIKESKGFAMFDWFRAEQ
jgi:beta-xylosidase